MSVTINIDANTTNRELAAIACLIAVLRSDEAAIPAPPRVLFDYSDNPLADKHPAPPAPPAAPPADPAPPVAADVPAPPVEVPAPPTPPAPASDALIQQEAARATNTGDLDVAGVPWDERIHAGTKVKNADGSWRTKRGADPALVASVTAELKGISPAGPAGRPAGPAGRPAADTPPPPTEPGPATVADAATAFGAGGAGGASDVPPPPPADGQSLQEKMAGVAAAAAGAPAPPPPVADGAAAADGAEALTYPRILDRAGQAEVTYDALNELAIGFGLTKFMDLPKRPDLFPLFMAALEEHIASAPAA